MLVFGVLLGVRAIPGVFVAMTGRQCLAPEGETHENSQNGCYGMETFHFYCSFLMESILLPCTSDFRGLRLRRQALMVLRR